MKIFFDDIQTFNIARAFYSRDKVPEAINVLSNIQSVDIDKLSLELKTGASNLILDDLSKKRSLYIYGVFDCPYYQFLSLEYSKIEYVNPTIKLDDKFSNIRCVKQISATLGLSNEQIVAIFPENFRNAEVKQDHVVYYFVDKFAKRHLKYTRQLIINFGYETLFQPLLSLSEHRLCELVTNWVNLHESSHRKGPMPIPEFLPEKSNKFTAALEELRADIESMLTCAKNLKFKNENDMLTGLFILSERLLAYPAFRSKNNFDTISSIILRKILRSHNLDLTSSFEEITGNLSLFNHALCVREQEIKESFTTEERKDLLMKFITDFIGSYDLEFETLIKFGEKNG